MDKKNSGGVGFVIIVVLFILLSFASCGGSSNHSSDIARDPDGFLGYSDDFWEWYVENN